MSKDVTRLSIIAKLRRFELFSRTTPELDTFDLWLTGRPMYFLLILLTAPIVFFIWALRRLLLLRFGVFNSNRIGDFAPEAQSYLVTQKRDLSVSWTFDIIGVRGPISNLQLLKMLARQIRVLPGAWL